MSTKTDQEQESAETKKSPLKMVVLVFGIPFVLMVRLAYLMRS